MNHRLLIIGVSIGASLAGATVAVADHIEGTSCGRTVECADHSHWPRMTMAQVQKAHPTKGGVLRGKKDRVNQLLGWHGSDTLHGGNESDVIWGDHIGANQPTTQHDRMYGYGGTDFIYSSHGRNTIYGGSGNDVIKIRYGRGFVDCGPGRDIINVPRSRKRRWTIRNCEKIDYRTEAERGGGMKPLK